MTYIGSGARVEPSVLDIFILSLLDRGFETTYDLQRQAGLSLGSTVPALRRLEAKRLIARQETLTAGARPKHSFTLTASGKKLARTGWKPFFKANRTDDLDATLRIAEMARADNVDPGEIRKFLERSSRTRLDSAKKQGSVAAEGSLDYVTTRSLWNRARLEAEAKFLAGLTEGYRKPTNRRR
jgi:DNA-binding PadR family transcriptional regulator